MAKELEPIIEVEGGDDASGSFMLTTVRMGRANIYSYIAAKVSKYQELYPENAIKSENESDEEYNVRQLHMMDHSKNSAIKVAYEKAGKPISFEYLGVYVLNTLEGMPAYGKLKPGDQITKVDQIDIKSAKQFMDYVGNKKPGEKVELTFKRDSTTKRVTLPLQSFQADQKRAGIGISLDDDKKPITEPAVKVNTEQIGGPSAGLMFTLEIYNQLTEGDMTKGYQIAGTGTMSETGEVGPIGGIQQKIVAAAQSGAQIFFAPNEKGNKNSNYRQALVTAKDIKTDMKIVPVDTLEDALTYLRSLKQIK
ncbi:hypothetical protein CUU64_08780 [Bacillus sp. V5-8f]|nr:hypothetical protein CUU64_08780 [Bacillus sp. V5-8f]